MRVLHVPYCWRPDPFGGTEHYVLGLWRGLRALGVEGAICAVGQGEARIRDDEPDFHLIADPGADSASFRDELYGEGSAPMARQFLDVVDRSTPDIVHFHSFTRLASARAAKGLAARGIPYVYTFHTPTTVCLRGDLRLEGSGACDGHMEAGRCARCWLGARGVPTPVRNLLARFAPPVLPTRGGSIAGALQLTKSHTAAALSFLGGARALVALCSWGRDVLLRNGMLLERIVLSRHGLDDDLLSTAACTSSAVPVDGPPTFVFVGRADRLKGADLFLRALQELRERELTACLFVVAQGERASDAVRELRCLAEGDQRIRFEAETPRARILEELAGATACVVPSRWLETGPLVVLESFAAGTPVVGTRLGGISELVENERNGLLFDLEDVRGLARAIGRLVDDPDLRARLRAGVSPPRPMSAVASDMKALYESVAGEPR